MSSNGFKAMNREHKAHGEEEPKIEDREAKKTMKQKKNGRQRAELTKGSIEHQRA